MERARSRSPRPRAPLLIIGEARAPLALEELRRLHRYDAARAPVRLVPAKGAEIANGELCDWRLSDEEFRGERFCPEDKEGREDTLAQLNATPRDARIRFVESTHVYYVDDKRAPWSGTTFSHYCEKHFDADAVLARTRPGWATKKGLVRADGSEMSHDEIKAVWDANGNSQSRRGTLLHWQLECYFNGYDIGAPHSPEFQMFLDFERHFLDALGLTPWRVEMNLFHCGLRLAGQADLVCTDHGGRLVILDWKRSKEIKDHGFNSEMQRPPLQHLGNSNRNTYNLQLNTYRHILESEYGLEVSGMYLVVLHPDQRPQVPHIYQVPRMEAEVLALVRQVAADKGVAAEDRPGADAPFDLAGLRF